mgnify:CR=1 FL=1
MTAKHTDKTPDSKRKSAANVVAQKQHGIESAATLMDNRPAAIAQKNLQLVADKAARANQRSAFTRTASDNVAQRKRGGKDHEGGNKSYG